eukprot:TRINITY_DN697_c0_g1_i1.p2 TRINITY_DN697_c0_g1~~TRINITY_DN697_c0_g1_i1.p2  ORF type:complete len:527 (+),score=248.54 TRINITY_DN697_c0_g1_i1:74-1582(+)
MPPHADAFVADQKLTSLLHTPPAAGSRVWPLSSDVLQALGMSPDQATVMSLDGMVKYLVAAHVAKHRSGGMDSFGVKKMNKVCDDDDEDDGCGHSHLKHTRLSVGKGVHEFQFKGEQLFYVVASEGDPVGTGCGAEYLTSNLLLTRGAGRQKLLQELCDDLVAEDEKHVENTYHLFQWNVERGHWKHRGLRTARPVESVVLPEEQQKLVCDDFAEFHRKDTRKFYTQHGIPYKRAYLFWGVPGTGKTSLIQALAGQWKRHVCFMQPTDPKFTDDMLKDAVTSAPGRSLIVFEDIDALFTKGRENRGKSAVTFSGLLNALDGVGMPEGQIFVLTTNFREQLDAALIRNGRVDVHVEFKHIADEQMASMFSRFFPSDADLAAEFVSELRKTLGGKADLLTPAVLQHYFIQQRKNDGRTVIDKIKSVADEVRRRESQEDAAKDEDKEKEKEKEEEEREQKRQAEAAAASKPTHHWHLSVSTSVMLTVIGALCLPAICRARAGQRD